MVLTELSWTNFLSCAASSFLPVAIFSSATGGTDSFSRTKRSRYDSYCPMVSRIVCRTRTCLSSLLSYVCLRVDLSAAFPLLPVAGRSATIEEVTTRAAAAAVTGGDVLPSARMPVADLGSTSPVANVNALSRELRSGSGNCFVHPLHRRWNSSLKYQSVLQCWHVMPA